MIIVRLGGGLGNQFFQYVAAYGVAHRLNTTLKLDITQCSQDRDSSHIYYRLGEFNITENFATNEEIERVRNHNLIKEPYGGAAFTPAVLDCPDDTFLEGHFFNPIYSKDVIDILRREFVPKHIHPVTESWRQKISSAKCSVSVHVRHGDLCIPIHRIFGIPTEYYVTCVNALKREFADITVFVFSDDPEWTRDNLKFDVPTEFVEGCETDAEEWYLMTLCNYNIIVKSTFSLAASYINGYRDKRVFVPQGYGIPMSDWIYVSIDYRKNFLMTLPPALSIIVYVDDSSNASVTVPSIVSQNSMDYEIIILDAGTNDFYRQFATNSNVTFIKLSPKVNRFKALNQGLDCVHGDYVILLDGADFVLPNAVNTFIQIGWEYFSKNKPAKGVRVNYLTYEQAYIDNSSNIICAVNRLQENPDGTLQINGLPDRKFNVVVDATFKDLDAVTDINIDAQQKLMLLGSGQLNNDLGTKFFKRKFLNEHGIRFDAAQQQGGGVVLKFLTDAFLSTENITLVPQLFYGRLK